MLMRTSSLLFIFISLILQLAFRTDSQMTHQNLPIISRLSCDLCARPIDGSTSWLLPFHSPCFHPGQPLFVWNNRGHCHPPRFFRSKFASLDANILFAKHRLCLYSTYATIQYEYSCFGDLPYERGHFFVVHPFFSKKNASRRRRWLVRRNPPIPKVHFQQERYYKDLHEDTPIQTRILTINAAHINNRSLFYSMIAPEDSRSNNLFILNTATGEIRLGKALDREILARHVLKVTAYEQLDPSVSASTTVIIDVIDVQDNAPAFERMSYYAEIREDSPIGTTVVSVFAQDSDEGLNGEIEYSLSEDKGFKLLRIDPATGVIRTVMKLDREVLGTIRISAIATDKGEPSMSSTALVEVAVLDVNDNYPKFEKELYNITVMENITVPVTLLQVKALDEDVGINGEVHYSIVESGFNSFSMDYTTGDLILREKLDPRSSPISLVIRAKDSAQPAKSSTVTCEIHVIDVNDHTPRFVAWNEQVIVDENIPVGREISRIFAIDDDTGMNGIINYSFCRVNASETHDFVIDENSGSIIVKNPLDRERAEKYELKVCAEDNGSPPRFSAILITVRVSDVNDNAPYFKEDFINISVSEMTKRGTQLASVKAFDNDTNQHIFYRIENAERNIFVLTDLGEKGAVLSLSGEFRNTDHTLRVVISGTDQGDLRGLCTININIEDSNSAPIFQRYPFTINVSEDYAIGNEVYSMRAYDNDRGNNAKLRYNLESRDFAINSTTGAITVVGTLDRELIDSYTLNVTVQDQAELPLSTSAIIEIIVEDVNDKEPVFSSANYSVWIPEDIPIGTSFFQVYASDADIGSNAFINYFIDDNDYPKPDAFIIDRSSGVIRIDQKLDREKIERYVLPVRAEDCGNPPLSCKSLLTIVLTDVNDNAPQFEFAKYHFWIGENSPPGTKVGTIIASDVDEGENAKISFKIFNGPDAKFFDIETHPSRNGELHLMSRVEFDYEARKNEFYFEIQASSEQLSSTVPVFVYVSDANDNRPQLDDFIALVALYEGERMDPVIGAVPAFDPDYNATLEFYMETNDVVSVHRISGELRLGNVETRFIDTEYTTCVSDGPNVACAKCRLIYVPIDEAALHQSVTIRLSGIRRDELLDYNVYQRLTSAISLLENWQPEDIRIFNIHSEDSDANITFCIISRGSLVSSIFVRQLLLNNKWRLHEALGLKMDLIESDICTKEPCANYQRCRQTQKYVNSLQLYRTDNFVLRSIITTPTLTCECPSGFISSDDTKNLCDIRIDLCFASPCMHGGKCIPLENGYLCDCGTEWEGDNCERSIFMDSCLSAQCFSGAECELRERLPFCRECTWNKCDTDDRCRLRSVSFDGASYITLPLSIGRIEWNLQMNFATTAVSGILAFAGNLQSDYIEISIENGFISGKFSLGDGTFETALPRREENRVNDGKWHHLTLDFFDYTLRVVLDNCENYIVLEGDIKPIHKTCASEVRARLKSRCTDTSVTCQRFLDISSQTYFGGKPGSSDKNHSIRENDPSLSLKHVSHGFTGCITNVTFNGILHHFSDFDEAEKLGNVQSGCTQMRNTCRTNTCGNGATCVNKWNGHHCRCPNRLHQSGNCENGRPLNPSLMLSYEESHVLWKIPKSDPFKNLSFEFRTFSLETFVINIDFLSWPYQISFIVSKGLGILLVNTQNFEVTYPFFADGEYKALYIAISGQTINVTVDYLYNNVFDLAEDYFHAYPIRIFTGHVPHSKKAQRFHGCIRNVEMNQEELQIQDFTRTKSGCNVQTECDAQDSCPAHSDCIHDMDRLSCLCHTGYIGDNCIHICTLPNICGAGTCKRTHSPPGYGCICPDGRTGRNCERNLPTQMCPNGWFGVFTKCKKCDCDVDDGFTVRCDRRNGQCLCEVGYFERNGHCVPCECGYGSLDKSCTMTGQCTCLGASTGLRCDRCASPYELLNPKSLVCEAILNSCPSNIEDGIQWATTPRGTTVMQNCGNGEIGVACRKCERNGIWQRSDISNCTSSQFRWVTRETGIFMKSVLLRNATRNRHILRRSNIRLALNGLETIISLEQRRNTSESDHLRTEQFVKNILKTVDSILSTGNYASFRINRIIFEYGYYIRKIHDEHIFLEPFLFCTDDLAFAIDTVSNSHSYRLPSFKNFVDNRRNNVFRQTEIQIMCQSNAESVRRKRTVAYSMATTKNCYDCKTIIVSSVIDQDCEIGITFPVDGKSNNWIQWRCAHLDLSTENQSLDSSENANGNVGRMIDRNISWLTDESNLIYFNRTHVTCKFPRSGVFTLLYSPYTYPLIQFTVLAKLPYSEVLCAAATLILLITSVIILVSNKVVNRDIQLSFIVQFLLDCGVVFIENYAQVSDSLCSFRNGLVTFCLTGLFAWNFLNAFSISRLYLEGNSHSSQIASPIIGFFVPLFLSIMTFLMVPSCTMQLFDWHVWISLIAVGLCLLLDFYCSAIMLILSLRKDFGETIERKRLWKVFMHHFILTVLIVLYNIVGLFPLYEYRPAQKLHAILNILQIFISLLILLSSKWSMRKEDGRFRNVIWAENNEAKSMNDAMEDDCHSPFLSPDTHSHYEAITHDPDVKWMPDVIPNDQSDCKSMFCTNVQRPTILSSPMTVLCPDSSYGCNKEILCSNEGTIEKISSLYTHSNYYTCSTFTS